MSILNDIEQIRQIDPQNMYNRIFDFPEQMTDALKIGMAWKVDYEDFIGVKNIVVAGMGGSAIGGELMRSFARSQLIVPVDICRNYVLPEYVDDESLVIVSSYSGNTEETLMALDDAIRRKAMLAAITTGGILEDVAALNQIPLAKLPGGLQPRAALGYSFIPLLLFLEKIRLLRNVEKEITDSISKLTAYRDGYIEDNPVEQNQAKKLAERIHGRIPVIYSGPSLFDAVALRWKGQICENGKNLAFCNVYPEFNHNELVGWTDTVAPYRDKLLVLQLRDAEDLPQIRSRMNAVKEIVERLEVEVIDVHSKGIPSLERMLSLVQLGDFVSYYLAVLNRVDPTPVTAIEELKQRLAKRTA